MKPVTQWFNAMHEPPQHEGLYEVRYAGCESITMRGWSQSGWLANLFGRHEGDMWRGLADKPKGRK